MSLIKMYTDHLHGQIDKHQFIKEVGGNKFFECPKCKKASFSDEEIRNLYCGFCHKYIDELLDDEIQE